MNRHFHLLRFSVSSFEQQYIVVLPSGFSILLCYLLASVYCCVTFWLQYIVALPLASLSILLCYFLALVVVLPFGFSIQLCYLLASDVVLPFGFSIFLCYLLASVVVLPSGFSIFLCYLLASVYYYSDTLEDALTQSSCLAFATPVQATDTDLHVYAPALAVGIWHTCA